jgi:hypothetical protein
MTNVLKWVGLVFTLSGALTTSLGIQDINIYLFNLGSLMYLSWAIRVRDVNLIIVNAGLLMIYVIGLIRIGISNV